jgi:hypothetical protein
MDEVIDWLTFYNHRRLDSTLGYVSPMKFEAHWRAGQVNKAASPSGYGLRRTRARSDSHQLGGLEDRAADDAALVVARAALEVQQPGQAKPDGQRDSISAASHLSSLP